MGLMFSRNISAVSGCSKARLKAEDVAEATEATISVAERRMRNVGV